MACSDHATIDTMKAYTQTRTRTNTCNEYNDMNWRACGGHVIVFEWGEDSLLLAPRVQLIHAVYHNMGKPSAYLDGGQHNANRKHGRNMPLITGTSYAKI